MTKKMYFCMLKIQDQLLYNIAWLSNLPIVQF